jgi:peptidoglycan/LPS O-acetylase OafA/YrhL
MLIAPVFWVPIALLILISSFSSSNGGGILWNNRPLQFLGEISFTFYLVHILVLRYVTMLFDIIKYDNIFVYIGITLALTILASALLDNYFVKPVTRWLKRIIEP